MAYPFLILIFIFTISQTVWGNSDFASCHPIVPLSTIEREFKKINCGDVKPLPVYIYGEKHIGQVTSETIRKVTRYASSQGYLYGWFEGEYLFENAQMSLSSRLFGIEGHFRILTDLTHLLTPVGTIAWQAHKSGKGLSDEYVQYNDVINFPRFLSEAVGAMKRKSHLWPQTRLHLPLDQLNPKLIEALDDFLDEDTSYKVYTSVNALEFTFLEADLFANSFDDFRTILNFFLVDVAKEMSQWPLFQDFDMMDMIDYSIGLRELEWVKEIQPQICKAWEEKKTVWIHVGEGHENRLECMLESVIDGLNVVSPTFYEVERKLSKWAWDNENISSHLDKIRDELLSFLESNIPEDTLSYVSQVFVYPQRHTQIITIEGKILDIDIVKLDLAVKQYLNQKRLVIVSSENSFNERGEMRIRYSFAPIDFMEVELSTPEALKNLWYKWMRL